MLAPDRFSEKLFSLLLFYVFSFGRLKLLRHANLSVKGEAYEATVCFSRGDGSAGYRQQP